jgi:Flp pilus assembly protein TadB
MWGCGPDFSSLGQGAVPVNTDRTRARANVVSQAHVAVFFCFSVFCFVVVVAVVIVVVVIIIIIIIIIIIDIITHKVLNRSGN